MTSEQTVFDRIRSATPDGNTIRLPLLVLSGEVVYPETVSPVHIDGKDNWAVVQHALKKKQTVIAVMKRPNAVDTAPLLEQIFPIGVEIALDRLPHSTEARADTKTLLAEGRRRVQLTELVRQEPYPMVKATILADVTTSEPEIVTRREHIFDLFQQIVDIEDVLPEELVDYVFSIEGASELADTLASTMNLDAPTRQKLLEMLDLNERLEYMELLITEELKRLQVEDEVNNRVHQEIDRVQREMYLREQMRVIQNELGETEEDFFQQELNELRQRILDSKMPDDVREKALKEASRLAIMAPMSPETGVIRTYIDWLLAVPWSEKSRDNLNIANAERVLEKAHYGLEKVKDRVLEHIAVRKLAKEKLKSPILCFVGPPGVGKTSLGRSIAEALGRQFVRVSLGGIHDEAEIRGHRRTYIGAMPGRIVQTMKKAGTKNPVFMLDEIDKLSDDYRGDPAAALLEVLDPEQNKEFIDHYMEVGYDLSEVLFIATANELYTLPEALEDRLEIIEFRAYTEEEKVEIAHRFLIPRQLDSNGLAKRGIRLQNDALEMLIRQYTLEAGVRNLEREIGSVCRKIARLVATRKPFPKRITPVIVEKFLGPPHVFKTSIDRENSVGVVTGLVWSSGGGDVQIIEASLLPGKGNLTLTGSLGDVLQESATTALSYMRSRAKEFGVPYEDFENYDVHIHMPEGAVPKEGPSAGITLAIAIISVFTERPIRADIAMTGEVTLRGNILPVGGVREKVLAARRHGVKNLILPVENKRDLVEVPKQALRDLNITFADNMQQVMDLTLLDAPLVRERDEDMIEDEAPKKKRTRKKTKEERTEDKNIEIVVEDEDKNIETVKTQE